MREVGSSPAEQEGGEAYCHRPSEGSGYYSNGCGLGITCMCELCSNTAFAMLIPNKTL